MSITCKNCIWFETFQKRQDEPSNMGCKESDWAGYVTNLEIPICGGIRFSSNEGGHINADSRADSRG